MHAAPLPPPRPRNPRRIPSLNREQQLGGGLRGVNRYSSETAGDGRSDGQLAHLPSIDREIGGFYGSAQASGQHNHLWPRKVRLQALSSCHFLPLWQTELILCNPNNAAAS